MNAEKAWTGLFLRLALLHAFVGVSHSDAKFMGEFLNESCKMNYEGWRTSIYWFSQDYLTPPKKAWYVAYFSSKMNPFLLPVWRGCNHALQCRVLLLPLKASIPIYVKSPGRNYLRKPSGVTCTRAAVPSLSPFLVHSLSTRRHCSWLHESDNTKTLLPPEQQTHSKTNSI